MTLIIEKANQRDFQRLTLAGINEQPGRLGTWRQPETGVVVQRITDAEAYATGVAAGTRIELGNPNYGLTNGYSRFECLSTDGKLLLGFGTTPFAILHNANLDPVRLIRSAYTSSKKAGDADELKWNPLDGKLYYMAGARQIRQDPATGEEEIILTLPATYRHTSDGSFSDDGRYLAMALNNGTVVLIDVIKRVVVVTIDYPRPNGVDVSPSGKFVKIDNFFYSASTGAKTGQIFPGHGGWALDADGREVFVSQQAGPDWIAAYYPDEDNSIYLQRMPGMDKTLGVAGMHCASDKLGYFKGWALISTYGGASALGDNVYLLEIKSQKLPGVKHPRYGGDLKAWEQSPVAPEAMPRIIRLCDMQNKWGGYFSEGWASVGSDHRIYFGANWNGEDNLELYRATLPPEVLETVGITTAPAWPQVDRVTGPAAWSTELPAGNFKITIEKE